MEITSSHNEQLKEVRKLAGRRWRDKPVAPSDVKSVRKQLGIG